MSAVLDMPCSELFHGTPGFSARAEHCIANLLGDDATVRQLVALSAPEMKHARNCSFKTLNYIRYVLNQHGLAFSGERATSEMDELRQQLAWGAP